ncbi:unnamed protein product [Trichogramma brassicae]|uniref:Uncharacterized protein n=1 Tax=Trichogramma brassicae TaxID=86971 RepID=A0A6H5ISH8_9HYME|nr:unnamed protein product [Trichogramma brassicae]
MTGRCGEKKTPPRPSPHEVHNANPSIPVKVKIRAVRVLEKTRLVEFESIAYLSDQKHTKFSISGKLSRNREARSRMRTLHFKFTHLHFDVLQSRKVTFCDNWKTPYMRTKRYPCAPWWISREMRQMIRALMNL